jgi:hypothetical protein
MTAIPVERHERHRPEQRQTGHRQKVLKGAAIITTISRSEIACTLRNQTGAGAELKVPADTPIPDEFLLYVPVDGVAYRSTVRWRRNDRVGVAFTGTERKPRLHYG